MTPVSLDCVLLCGEDNSSVFDDSDWRGGAARQQPVSPQSRRRRRDPTDDELALPVLSEDCLRELLEKERQHLPQCDYLKRLQNGDVDLGARIEAIDWMFMVGQKWVLFSVNHSPFKLLGLLMRF